MSLTAADFTVNNATSADIAALNLALSYLSGSPTGNAIMQQVAAGDVTINIIHDGQDGYLGTEKAIFWDPHSAQAVASNTVGTPPRKSQVSRLLEPRTTTDGVLPLDEPITIKLNDTLLRVPAAYLSPWPQQKLRNRVNSTKSLRFEFWMPDKRHLEISPLSNASFRPLEPGRGEPASDAYIVRVWDLQPIKLDEPGYISPEQAYQNRISTPFPPNSKYSSQDEPFGLVRFWLQDQPASKFAVEYRHKEGGDPQILLDCAVPDRWRVNPECGGRVHFVADDLAFFVVFPREEVSHWHDVVLAARDLYRSWKVSP